MSAGALGDLGAWLRAANLAQYEAPLAAGGWDLPRLRALDEAGRRALLEATLERNSAGRLKKAHESNFGKAFALLGPAAASAADSGRPRLQQGAAAVSYDEDVAAVQRSHRDRCYRHPAARAAATAGSASGSQKQQKQPPESTTGMETWLLLVFAITVLVTAIAVAAGVSSTDVLGAS